MPGCPSRAPHDIRQILSTNRVRQNRINLRPDRWNLIRSSSTPQTQQTSKRFAMASGDASCASARAVARHWSTLHTLRNRRPRWLSAQIQRALRCARRDRRSELAYNISTSAVCLAEAGRAYPVIGVGMEARWVDRPSRLIVAASSQVRRALHPVRAKALWRERCVTQCCGVPCRRTGAKVPFRQLNTASSNHPHT